MPDLLFARSGDIVAVYSRAALAAAYPLAAPPRRLHVISIGEYTNPADGSRLSFDRALLQRLADQANAEAADLVVDWRHASFEPPPAPAPAAAHLSRTWTVDDDGLHVDVLAWTPAGDADVRNGAYRYLSAGIEWDAIDPRSGRTVTRLHHVALTNQPVIDDLTPLSLSRGALQKGDGIMKEKLLAMLKARGIELAADATDEQIAAAVEKVVGDADAAAKKLAEAIGIKEGEPATPESATAALERARNEVPAELRTALGCPDAALPAAVESALKLRGAGGDANAANAARLAALERRVIDGELDEAIKDGRITPAMRGDYEALLASGNPAVVTSTRSALAKLPRRGPLSPALDTPGKAPADLALAEAEKNVRRLMGMKE